MFCGFHRNVAEVDMVLISPSYVFSCCLGPEKTMVQRPQTYCLFVCKSADL